MSTNRRRRATVILPCGTEINFRITSMAGIGEHQETDAFPNRNIWKKNKLISYETEYDLKNLRMKKTNIEKLIQLHSDGAFVKIKPYFGVEFSAKIDGLCYYDNPNLTGKNIGCELIVTTHYQK